MTDFLPDPTRWKERTDQANMAEREAGRALRFMATPAPLPAAQLTRIAARIRAERPRRRLFWLTVTAALLLGGATIASAAHLNVLPSWLARIVKSQPAETTPQKRALLGPSTRPRATASVLAPTSPGTNPQLDQVPTVSGQPEPVASAFNAHNFVEGAPAPLATPQPAPPPPPPPVEHPTTARARSLSAELAPAPMVAVPSDSPRSRVAQVALLEKPAQPALAVPAEAVPEKAAASSPEDGAAQGTAKYLSEAIHALRVEHSPGNALFLLDRNATVLGQGPFAHEALLLRVEAMMALERKGEVLRLLDGTALIDVAASRALLLTRGELRAAANRFADGLGDFDRVLSLSKQPDRQALSGRALCRMKLGDSAGAKADVERYRREFPSDSRLHDLERRIGELK